MPRLTKNTLILCFVVALTIMSTSFLPCHAEGNDWCVPESKGAVCQKPVTPENTQTCQNYCKGFGFNPEQGYCVSDPVPKCCCANHA
ncbi:unnamed protein product [Alopecurus aequalis]